MRSSIVTVCEALAIELGKERLNQLKAMGLPELSSLLDKLKQLRAWPQD